MTDCPCGSEQTYQKCCGPFIDGKQKPSTPEQLMRSRYSAYTQAKIEYIASTSYGRTSKDLDIEATQKWAEKVKWIKLEVKNSSVENDKGFVEFIAHFSDSGKASAIHELSEFIQKDGEWFYVDGRVPSTSVVNKNPVGRNDACPCGSGKKFKKCCI